MPMAKRAFAKLLDDELDEAALAMIDQSRDVHHDTLFKARCKWVICWNVAFRSTGRDSFIPLHRCLFGGGLQPTEKGSGTLLWLVRGDRRRHPHQLYAPYVPADLHRDRVYELAGQFCRPLVHIFASSERSFLVWYQSLAITGRRKALLIARMFYTNSSTASAPPQTQQMENG